MGMYSYGQRGTYLNGFLTYIANNTDLKISNYGQLNEHLKAIRFQQEPKKPISNDVEKNSFYIQENYDWNVVIEYFKNLNSKTN